MRNDRTYAHDPVPWVQVMLSGVSLGSSTPLIFVRLFAAIRRVHLFYRKKFDERGPSGSEDLIYDLPPRQLATSEEYSKGFRVYFGFIALIVLMLSLVRPENLRSPGLPIHPSSRRSVVALSPVGAQTARQADDIDEILVTAEM
jgi:hypothetical protein